MQFEQFERPSLQRHKHNSKSAHVVSVFTTVFTEIFAHKSMDGNGGLGEMIRT